MKFDVIGDIHGQHDKLVGLLEKLGYREFTGPPRVISKQFACLDYSVAKDGPLVAYRWDGEAGLTDEKLAWV